MNLNTETYPHLPLSPVGVGVTNTIAKDLGF